MSSSKLIVEKLLYISREVAEDLLKKTGEVAVFGLTLDANGDSPFTYYPLDDFPRASAEELVDLVSAELRRRAQSGTVGAASIVTTLVNGTKRAFAVQLETTSSVALLIYPYRKTVSGWHIDQPQSGQGNFADYVFDH